MRRTKSGAIGLVLALAAILLIIAPCEARAQERRGVNLVFLNDGYPDRATFDKDMARLKAELECDNAWTTVTLLRGPTNFVARWVDAPLHVKVISRSASGGENMKGDQTGGYMLSTDEDAKRAIDAEAAKAVPPGTKIDAVVVSHYYVPKDGEETVPATSDADNAFSMECHDSSGRSVPLASCGAAPLPWGRVRYFSSQPKGAWICPPGVLAHELGHAVFDLGDEYTAMGKENDRPTHQVLNPNLTSDPTAAD